ncbi:AEC family transporter [Roseovarius sp. EL26]|uniref:AEC family transporter n=1 Tax=Roseovarius sp. EL26 TaxID=2126672 RepID=UPI000EA357DB|nr:AEC family transporter [Roseovarius sp. EL26]
MNLSVTVLNIVAPVFCLAGIGYIWVKLGFDYPVQFITRLAMTIAVPCLIFTALMQSKADLASLKTLSIASIASHLAIVLIFAVLLRLGQLDRQTYLAPLTFGNTGNLGLPLALFAFGQAGLEMAVVILAISAVLSFTVGIWLVAGQGAFGKMLREPMIGATLLGALFLWQGWQTPQVVTRTMDLIGQMAIPLMLMTLGVAIARLSAARLKLATALSLIKLLICVIVAWGIGHWFQLDQVAFGVLVLQTATPVAVTSYLLAEKYQADSEAVAGLVMVSTLMSVIALPVLLAFLL